MKLMELVVPANDQMTAVQQKALLSIYLARGTSPAAAAAELKGDEKKMAAGEYLLTKRYIIPTASGVDITQRGGVELVSLGLIAQGQVTPKGRQLIDGEENDRSRETGGNAQNPQPTDQGNIPRF